MSFQYTSPADRRVHASAAGLRSRRSPPNRWRHLAATVPHCRLPPRRARAMLQARATISSRLTCAIQAGHTSSARPSMTHTLTHPLHLNHTSRPRAHNHPFLRDTAIFSAVFCCMVAIHRAKPAVFCCMVASAATLARNCPGKPIAGLALTPPQIICCILLHAWFALPSRTRGHPSAIG